MNLFRSYVDLWGTVTQIAEDGAEDELPPDDDPQVAQLCYIRAKSS